MVESYLTGVSNFLWQYSGLNYIAALLTDQKEAHQVCKEQLLSYKPVKATVTTLAMQACGRGFVRLAGVSGALAVGFGAYGAHVFSKKEIPEELKQVYETANRYHLIHTLALLGVPLTRRPMITGSLIALGMLLFSGSCYFHALTGNTTIRQVTPYGGMLLMIGWLSMVL